MREIVLIADDAYLADDSPRRDATPAAPTFAQLAALLRYARRVPGQVDWLELLADELGLASPVSDADLALRAVGAVAAEPQARALRAFAVRLEAGLTQVRLAADGLIDMTPEAAAQLSRAFNTEFVRSPEPYRLEAADDGSFILHGAWLEDVTTVDPRRLLGGTITEGLPSGERVAPLRKLWSEIELWLAQNRSRWSHWREVPNALWLCGAARRVARPARRATVDCALFARDVTARGLALMAGVSAYSACSVPGRWPSCGHVYVVAPLQQVVGEWLPVVQELLGTRRLAHCRLHLNDRSFDLGPRDRWRLWRRAADWRSLVTRP
ncbi:MAG: hypothetical protein R3E77_07255 [Steroidobacteraceae bacterium]